MAISLEKILNVSLSDYLKTKYNDNVPNYDFVGLHMTSDDIKNYVHVPNYDLVGVHSNSNDIEEFAKLVPDEAEIVVNYKIALALGTYTSSYHQCGTALVPKSSIKPKE
ncbi:MAG: hypothetical protein AABX83_03830 [Nanoarchaeota archaeon]